MRDGGSLCGSPYPTACALTNADAVGVQKPILPAYAKHGCLQLCPLPLVGVPQFVEVACEHAGGDGAQALQHGRAGHEARAEHGLDGPGSDGLGIMMSPLHLAAALGDAARLQEPMKAPGDKEPSSHPTGASAEEGRGEAVELLLGAAGVKVGVDVNAKDSLGDSVLHHARTWAAGEGRPGARPRGAPAADMPHARRPFRPGSAQCR